jgi:hypothetical protein
MLKGSMEAERDMRDDIAYFQRKLLTCPPADVKKNQRKLFLLKDALWTYLGHYSSCLENYTSRGGNHTRGKP